MTTPAGLAPIVRFIIQDPSGRLVELGDKFHYFEWSSFINGGYNVRMSLYDHLYNRIHELASSFYLRHSRGAPLQAAFQIGWGNTTSGTLFTSKLTSFITQIAATGEGNAGEFCIESIDPASYILSSGKADGGAKKGNLSSVIRDIINIAVEDNTAGLIDFVTGKRFKLITDITETLDNKNGIWYPMNMEPITFIKSSLEWSPSITSYKSMWIIASGTATNNDASRDTTENGKISLPAIYIKQWPEMYAISPKKDLGILNFNTNTPNKNDILNINFIGNNFISTSSIELRTSGISAVTGAVYDARTSNSTIVNDENTPNKLKPRDLDENLSYTKPTASKGIKLINRGVTNISPIPEMNGGDLGINYGNYIDGRARQQYLQLINGVMRIKVRLIGWHYIDDSRMLGTATVNLNWKDSSGDPYFLSGKWILYGFKHIISRDNWFTDLYLSRIDHNSIAIETPPVAGI